MDELISGLESSGSVNVIIGENGCGKSEYLNKLAAGFLREGKPVVAIATSIYDKFTVKSKRFSFLGGRQGRNVVEKTIKKALAYGSRRNEVGFSGLVRALQYTNYKPVIRVIVEGYGGEEDISKYVDNIFSLQMASATNILKTKLDYGQDGYFEEGVYDFDLTTFYNHSTEGERLRDLLLSENHLKSLGVIKKLRLELLRGEDVVPLSGASSGELMILSGLVHIAMCIEVNCAIIIDEPENSLHPRWQQQYVANILDLFYHFEPQIVIATHSPLIIPFGDEKVKVFKKTLLGLYEVSVSSSNNEELLAEAFGVLTPENRYLSDEMVKILNSLGSGEIDLASALNTVKMYRNKIYDERQIKFLEDVTSLMHKVKRG